MRPTADCIMNSFLTSGKKHIVITGAKKSGKSTLIKEIKVKMSLLKSGENFTDHYMEAISKINYNITEE